MAVYRLQKNNAELIIWSFLMIQSVRFTSAAFEAFAETCFLLPASAAKCWRMKWKCKEKQRTVNHMIIFNDSISTFYQCSIQGFCRDMFFITCLGSKMLKDEMKMQRDVSRNKIYLCLKYKSNVRFENVICLSHDFQTWFYNADHLLYYPQMPVFSFHTFFVLLYQFLRSRT